MKQIQIDQSLKSSRNLSLRKYDEALEFHKQAMVLSPHNASSYAAIGFVYSLKWKWNEAVEYFHKVCTRFGYHFKSYLITFSSQALGLKRDDPFSTNMLQHSIDHLINGISSIDEDSPPYESPSYIEEVLAKKTSSGNLLIPKEEPLEEANLSISAMNESSMMDVEMDISSV